MTCAPPEDGVRKEAGGGTLRSPPLGLGSCGSADGEAAGQVQQTPEEEPGLCQRSVGSDT